MDGLDRAPRAALTQSADPPASRSPAKRLSYPMQAFDPAAAQAFAKPHPATEGKRLIEAVRDHVEYAFQPIVSLQSGICYGYEALLRGHAHLGLPTIAAVFDEAWRLGILHTLDLLLRRKALEGFCRLSKPPGARLFFNLDNRVFASPDYQPNQTRALLTEVGLAPSTFCFELSELHAFGNERLAQGILDGYRAQSLLLAIDDFGIGLSGLSVLYARHPDVVKIDRMFISGIDHDRKKRVLVTAIVNLARVLGMAVVAEGIETEAEFLACRRTGCDLGQGFFIAAPETDLAAIDAEYAKVPLICRRERREDAGQGDRSLIREELSRIPTVGIDDEMADVFDMFRKHTACTYFPVLDGNGRPVGIIHEQAIKTVIYSEYGRDLLRNPSFGRRLRDFMSDCPIADIRSEAEEVLSIYAIDENPVGVLVVEDFRYVGVLSAPALLRVIHEKTLTRASDENPLTKLPGNLGINEYLAGALDNSDDAYVFAYFDIDNFKPYNDTYGFRQGDRVIQLLAQLLVRRFSSIDGFVGHIGGDDFFVGVRGHDEAAMHDRVAGVLETFRSDAESFYDPSARSAGGIIGTDRHDVTRTIPLMTASAGLLSCAAGPRPTTVDALTDRLSQLKKRAKAEAGHIAAAGCACHPDCLASATEVA